MSIYKDGKLIAGGRQCMPLLSFMWADHELNDVSWLRADTFSWQSGAVYQAAYQHLADDIDGKTLQSETISGTTVQFYLADDGHKICPVTEESNVSAIYNATGVAWYYILDTVNQRFKLPRTQFGVTGLRDTVGKYIEAGLPNITGNTHWIGAVLNNNNTSYANGVFSAFDSNNGAYAGGGGYSNAAGRLSFDASRSSSVYGNSTTVQPKATQMYLYFYVGNFTQTALENTAGLNTELFNGKADLNLANVLASIDFVVEKQEPTAENNYTWYRKYRSGWVEQGQYTTTTSGQITQFNYPIAMSDSNYTLQITPTYFNSGSSATVNVVTKTETGFSAWGNQTGQGGYWAVPCGWQVSGMAA